MYQPVKDNNEEEIFRGNLEHIGAKGTLIKYYK